MSSMTYWKTVEAVKEELDALASAGQDAYGNLESTDSPGDAAEELAAIEKRLTKLAGLIAANVPALRKIQKALDALPGIR